MQYETTCNKYLLTAFCGLTGFSKLLSFLEENIENKNSEQRLNDLKL